MFCSLRCLFRRVLVLFEPRLDLPLEALVIVLTLLLDGVHLQRQFFGHFGLHHRAASYSPHFLNSRFCWLFINSLNLLFMPDLIWHLAVGVSRLLPLSFPTTLTLPSDRAPALVLDRLIMGCLLS